MKGHPVKSTWLPTHPELSVSLVTVIVADDTIPSLPPALMQLGWKELCFVNKNQVPDFLSMRISTFQQSFWLINQDHKIKIVCHFNPFSGKLLQFSKLIKLWRWAGNHLKEGGSDLSRDSWILLLVRLRLFLACFATVISKPRNSVGSGQTPEWICIVSRTLLPHTHMNDKTLSWSKHSYWQHVEKISTTVSFFWMTAAWACSL